jgi:hypothetical protein
MSKRKNVGGGGGTVPEAQRPLKAVIRTDITDKHAARTHES